MSTVEWDCGPVPLYMVCADRRLLTPTIRTFRDFIQEMLPACLY